MKNAMKATATKPSENAIGIPENITASVTPPNSRPSERTLIRRARLIGARRTIDCSSSWTTSSVIPAAIRPYGIVSGGEKVDEVVILSTHASWNSVQDFHAKNAQNASDIRSTMIIRIRLAPGGRMLETASMPTCPRCACTHAPHRKTAPTMQNTATSSCQSVAARKR